MTSLSASTAPTSDASGQGAADPSAHAGVPGVAQPTVRPVPVEPVVDIKVNLAAAERYGLRPGDVRRDATTLTSGLIVGNLYEQSKIYDVVVWGQPQVRGNLTELGNLLIDTPSGGQVRLKDVASLTVRPEPTAIIHDDVLAEHGRDRQRHRRPGRRDRRRTRGVATVAMPYEYHAEVLGNATSTRTTTCAGWPTAGSRWSACSCCCRPRWALAPGRAGAGLAAAVGRRRGPRRADNRRGLERRVADRTIRRAGPRRPRQHAARPPRAGHRGRH